MRHGLILTGGSVRANVTLAEQAERAGFDSVLSCRAALASFDVPAMAAAIPDSLVDEIAIACPPEEARDRLADWGDLTDEPLFYAPQIGVPPERLRANLDAILDVFGKR